MRRNNSLGLLSMVMNRFGHPRSANGVDLFYLYSSCALADERMRRALVAGRSL